MATVTVRIIPKSITAGASTGCDVRSCDRMEKSYFFCQEGNKPLGLSMVRTLSHVSNMPLKGPLR